MLSAIDYKCNRIIFTKKVVEFTVRYLPVKVVKEKISLLVKSQLASNKMSGRIQHKLTLHRLARRYEMMPDFTGHKSEGTTDK